MRCRANRARTSLLAVALGATLGTARLTAAADTALELLRNLDLSRGLDGWTTWSSAAPHAHALDSAVGHAGRPSIRIEAKDATASLMVMTAGEGPKPGQRYVVSAWWRVEDPSDGIEADARCIFRKADGTWLNGVDLNPFRQETAGDWIQRQYRLSVPDGTAHTTFGVWVRNGTGRIWVSDLSIRPLDAVERTFDSMYLYDPEQVPLGMAPLRAFYALQDTDSPFLPRARHWNRLLVELARWQEDVARARRAAFYRGDALSDALSQALAQALGELDRLQQAYGRLYVAGRSDGLATELDGPLTALETAIRDGRAQVARALAETTGTPAAGAWLEIPKARTDLPWWDAEKRRPRYILWMRWSDVRFYEAEEPLDMGDGFTLTEGRPATFENGVASWQNYLDQRAKHVAAGIRRSALITHYALHDKGYLAPEFVRQNDAEPDLRLWGADGKPLGAESGVTQFNWLNPRARAHMVDVLTQMAGFFRERTEYQFYIDCWESGGPYVQDGLIGRNPSHISNFQEWLTKRYGTIAELNRRWGTQHAGFAELRPTEEPLPAFAEPVPALQIETRRWAQEAFVDYATRIRDTIAARDPTKPVIAQHSGLLSRVQSPRVWDSADILGYHNRARTTMPVQVWLASTQRYTHKPTALFENFWGCQEDHPARLNDEKAMRAQMRRYVYRHAVWGRCLQTWWYAYTSAPYLLSYNGNWFTPTYDLTTLRYCAAGFPVEKAKIDRLQALLLDSVIAPSRLLILQPYATMLAQGQRQDVTNEWLAWHNLLFPRNLLYEMLPDEWFTAGVARLDDFDTVILPAATHLSADVAKRLAELIQAGGTVIASGPPGLFDECGQPTGTLLAAAGATCRRVSPADAPWRFDFGLPPGHGGWATASLGKGRLVLLPEALSRLPDKEALAALVRERIVPAAEAPGTTLELLLRRLPDGRALLCALNRDPDAATVGEVIVRGTFDRVADVDMERPCQVPSRSAVDGRTAFRLSLDAGATAYYLLQ